MKSIVVGTAGHIDHGKTALVKALTGIDADRLEEEKRRGITIDLGFAHMDLTAPGGEILRIGFVDVPGHERFVRNMLAGIGGIDLVLLVIAADEAIKPQTREHFDILRLLGVQQGIAVLTKSDAVDSETLAIVRMEVKEFLRGTFLDKPDSMVAVSALTGAGLDELKQKLAAAAVSLKPRDADAIARLPIDRVFSMKGFGTVVTGTLISGTIRRDDELEVFPGGKRTRARGAQAHGQTAEFVIAGQRSALNLAGLSREELARGMTLAPLETFEATRQVDVRLQLLASADHPIKNRAKVHFHCFSMETVAEVLSYEMREIRPGESVFARLKLAKAALLLPGDRFIVRQFSPVVTIGGGIILDAAPILRMPGPAEFLKVLENGDAASTVTARISRREQAGVSLNRLVAETGWAKPVLEKVLAPLARAGHIVRVGEIYVHNAPVEALKTRIVETVAAFQAKNTLQAGINQEELRASVGASPEVFELAAGILIRAKKIESVNDVFRLPGRGVVMRDDEAESSRKIEDAFALAGLKVPALREVLAGLKVDKLRAQKIVTLLLRDKVLVKVSEELVFHRQALEELRRQMAALKGRSPNIDVAKFKEVTGVSRKYAIPLLEYLDRERVTKRVGDTRQIL